MFYADDVDDDKNKTTAKKNTIKTTTAKTTTVTTYTTNITKCVVVQVCCSLV